MVDSVRAAFDNGSVDTSQLVSWFSLFVRGSVRQEIDAPMEPLSFMIQHGAPNLVRPRVRAYGGSLYRPLYQKLGFVPVGQSETFVHPLTEADLLHIIRSD